MFALLRIPGKKHFSSNLRNIVLLEAVTSCNRLFFLVLSLVEIYKIINISSNCNTFLSPLVNKSGKIMRRALKTRYMGTDVGDISISEI